MTGEPGDAASPTDDTVAVDRQAQPVDAEATVAREHVSVVDVTSLHSPTRRRRERPTPPGVLRPPAVRSARPEGVEASAAAADGVGPGTTSQYAPRPIPAPPEAPAAHVGGPQPTRSEAPRMPSVSRATTRRSRLVLVCLLLACVVSVTGLWLVAAAILAG